MDEIIYYEDLNRSSIQEFFSGANVLVTGGTGFLGKVLTEKLLRSCPDIGAIYLLVRPKKGKDIQQRVDQLFDGALYSLVEAKCRLKVQAVSGDCELPGLGLSPADRQFLADNVNVVFHAAATVRFNETLKMAVSINVTATKELLDFAREMTHLKSFVHVSTAYANCIYPEIKEKFYTAPVSSEKLMQLTKCIDDEYLDRITPMLLDKWPNTYVFTKAVAEELVKEQSKGLPVAIFRPVVVVGTRWEPLPGWIDNLQTATGVIVGCGTGVLRTMLCDKDVFADIVPVDMACNAMIAAAWDVANRQKADSNHNEPANKQATAAATIPIYNYVSSTENPITWGEVMDLTYKHGMKVPPMSAIWVVSMRMNKSVFLYRVCDFMFHFVPATIIDCVAYLLGKRANMLKLYRKVHTFSGVLAYFCTHSWRFHNDNVQELWCKLEPKDKQLFPFSMKQLDWNDYFHHYVRGVRHYVLKEDPSNIPQAKNRYRRLYWAHQLMKLLLLYVGIRMMWFIFRHVVPW